MENYKSYKTKYHYCYFGNIQTWELDHLEPKSNREYQIDVPLPIDYDSVEEALNCNATLVFTKDNGHIVLAVYEHFEQGFNEQGKWHERAFGKILDVITWDQWWRYTMSVNKPELVEVHNRSDACRDFIPTADNWNELFQVEKLSDDWYYMVQGLAYSIIANVSIQT